NGGNATGPTVPHSAGAGPRKVSRTRRTGLDSSSLAVERPGSYYGGMNERALELNPWRAFNAA
ncbi:MAG: hypothetical protein ACP5O7_12490, partial [Phycisphaerae bacterium]